MMLTTTVGLCMYPEGWIDLFSRMIFTTELPTWALLVEFAIAAAIIVFTGRRFVVLADKLADRLNIGGGWIGIVLLASVTSLPELITSATAVSIHNVDLAFGGILGSCICNDRRWAETYRVLALRGAEMVVLGYNTPTKSFWEKEENPHADFHNHLSMQAGAYQNSVWVVGRWISDLSQTG